MGTVLGKAYEDNAAGATSVIIQYKTTDSQKNYVGCQVGANPNPVTDGCFAPSGSMTVAGSVVTYSYDPLADNSAKRSIAGFSTGAQKKMYECANCPYKLYEDFYNYYGEYDYANQIVLAAFNGEATTFMNIWMYVIREMEDALDDCQEACTIENCN